MRATLLILVLAGCVSTCRGVEPEKSLPAQYLDIYLKIDTGEHGEKNGDLQSARQSFIDCRDKLMAIHNAHPDWESSLVIHRLADCEAKIRDLDQQIAAASVSAPGSTNAPSAQTPTPLLPASRKPTKNYPWKEHIKIDLFWIGKDAKASAWNASWTKTNGGEDAPANRNGYATASHASSVNPFYVALPFNDLAHPGKANEFIPREWHRAPLNGKKVSACKDRWVWMKTAEGRTCFAQWEDVGPGDDDAAYVFGQQPPATKKAALLVSPAVGQYLQIDRDALISWRFVDEADVPPGQWLKYDEQAVLYTAMHEMQKTK